MSMNPTITEFSPGLIRAGLAEYVPMDADEVSRWMQTSVGASVRFDVPRRNQGQIVEVAYGALGAGEAGRGDPWMRVIDRSDGSTTFWRLVAVSETGV